MNYLELVAMKKNIANMIRMACKEDYFISDKELKVKFENKYKVSIKMMYECAKELKLTVNETEYTNNQDSETLKVYKFKEK